MQRGALVRDGPLLMCAAAMAETAVGGSPSRGLRHIFCFLLRPHMYVCFMQ